MKIFISRNGQQFGPYSIEEAQQLIQRGQLSPDDLACAEGGTQWVPLASLLAPPAAVLPPSPGPDPPAEEDVQATRTSFPLPR